MATYTKLDVLRGTIDEDNPLSILRANSLVWLKIFTNVEKFYNSYILQTENAYKSIAIDDYMFPPSKNININMMPIKSHCAESIPTFLDQYIGLINYCSNFCDRNKTIYLTIQESIVEPCKSQRRPGVHIERPGVVKYGGKMLIRDMKNKEYLEKKKPLAWGLGYCDWNDDIPIDGIFMMSSVANSCQIWPVQIQNPEQVSDVSGGIEHMRPYLGQPYKLKKNELVWFTDTTPHESLSIDTEKPIYRQFFRLVIGDISVWYSKHNTPNPLGILPDAPISDANKFES